MKNVGYWCPVLLKFRTCQRILLNPPNTNFVENPLSCSPPVTWRQTERHTQHLANCLLQTRHNMTYVQQTNTENKLPITSISELQLSAFQWSRAPEQLSTKGKFVRTVNWSRNYASSWCIHCLPRYFRYLANHEQGLLFNRLETTLKTTAGQWSPAFK